eukprot:scaffold1055_cov297-Alexandrium_tamarense.AAC.2
MRTLHSQRSLVNTETALKLNHFKSNSLDREGVEFVSRSLKATQSFGSFYSMVIILRMKLTSVGSAAQ